VKEPSSVLPGVFAFRGLGGGEIGVGGFGSLGIILFGGFFKLVDGFTNTPSELWEFLRAEEKNQHAENQDDLGTTECEAESGM